MKKSNGRTHFFKFLFHPSLPSVQFFSVCVIRVSVCSVLLLFSHYAILMFADQYACKLSYQLGHLSVSF